MDDLDEIANTFYKNGGFLVVRNEEGEVIGKWRDTPERWAEIETKGYRLVEHPDSKES